MLIENLGDLAVFPCSAAKRPLIHAWPKNARRIEPPPFWPLVGVLTGSANGFDVLDLECEGLAWLASAGLPETRRHKTPRGYHYLFRSAEGFVRIERLAHS
jgi:hypothetical protein